MIIAGEEHLGEPDQTSGADHGAEDVRRQRIASSRESRTSW
ncbi:MAG TPA: hypothetical protein VF416_08370 [Marmoricola sp.]